MDIISVLSCIFFAFFFCFLALKLPSGSKFPVRSQSPWLLDRVIDLTHSTTIVIQ